MVYYVVDPQGGKIESFVSEETALNAGHGKFLFWDAVSMYEEFGEDLTLKLFDRLGVVNHQELFVFIAQRVGKTWRASPVRNDQIETEEKEPVMADKIVINKESKIKINPDYDGRPRRAGSHVAKLFELYEDGMTVAEWLEAVAPLGGTIGNLRKDVTVGRVTLS